MQSIKIIPSKSDAHRALICAALSENLCEIICDETSADIEATTDCMVAMKVGNPIMECGESGSTFRFLIPVMAALGRRVEFMPKGRLPERPLSPMYEELERHGCKMSPQGSVPFVVDGKLKSGVYKLPGNVSSQYITGLLLALPLLEGDSEIHIEGTLESKGYVDLTLDVLKKFGVKVTLIDSGFRVPGGQVYCGPDEYAVEGDWSNAAFWLVAGALLLEGLKVDGISRSSLQGDKKIVDILKAFGACVEQDETSVTVSKGSLKGMMVDASQIPDMVPALALLAAVSKGRTVINNAGRLRIKESDRLATIAETLNAIGASVKEKPDGLIIDGRDNLKGGKVNGHNDHRIVMMAAIASLVCEEKVTIIGSEAVNKSYPSFFHEMEILGIDNKIIRK